MTEKEAIEELKCYRAQSGTSYPEEIEMAIVALEEIQQYREIEKRLEDMYGGQLPLAAYVDVLEYALKEPGKPHPVNARILTYEDVDAWEAYKAIGTPEECQIAMIKYLQSKPEKPEITSKFYMCKKCGRVRSIRQKHAFCEECGCEFDWSEEE